MVIDVVKVPTLLSSGIIVAVNRFATVASPVKFRGQGHTHQGWDQRMSLSV